MTSLNVILCVVIVLCSVIELAWSGGHGGDHVHIKVHIPEIHKKHTHVKTIYRHHYYPKKTETHHHHVKKKKKQITWHARAEPDFAYEKGHNYDVSWYSKSKSTKPKINYNWEDKHDWSSDHDWDSENYKSDDWTGGHTGYEDPDLGGSSIYSVAKPLSPAVHLNYHHTEGHDIPETAPAEEYNHWPISLPSELENYSTLPDDPEVTNFDHFDSVIYDTDRPKMKVFKTLRTPPEKISPIRSYQISLKPRIVARKSLYI